MRLCRGSDDAVTPNGVVLPSDGFGACNEVEDGRRDSELAATAFGMTDRGTASDRGSATSAPVLPLLGILIRT
jgi:hypothetical protein